MFNYNYALSTWVYIDNQPIKFTPNDSGFISLINYGNKPNIRYNISKNTFQVSNLDGKNEKILFTTNSIKLQKWNNFIINYESNILDIFINGELVSSSKGIMPYMTDDRITIGEEKGVRGAICNTIAFSKPLGLKQIGIIYNTLKGNSPPIL